MQATICRLYETHPDAMLVVEALQAAGVADEDISLISNNSDNWFGADAGAAKSEAAKSRATSKPAKSSQHPSSDTKPGDGISAGAGAAGGSAEDNDDLVPQVTPEVAKGSLVGAALGATATALGGLAALAIPGIGPAVGAGWLLALASAGAAVGATAGGLVGALTAAGIDEADAHAYAEGVRRGGSLVAARVSPEDARRVEDVMASRAIDIGERRAGYRREGWKAFNPDAAPYSAEQVRTEREMHRAA
jgi:hypothetical protein